MSKFQNGLDRAIAYVAPGIAARRMRSRIALNLLGGYKGGKRKGRGMAEFAVAGGSGDSDTLPDLPALRVNSHELYRNSPVATSIINTHCELAIGAGHQLSPTIDREFLGLSDDAAEELELAFAAEWRLFSENDACDVTRGQTFAQMEDLALRSKLLGGDVFVLPRFLEGRPGAIYSSCLQLIEADRCCNENRAADTTELAGGVRTDKDGAPVEYHFADQHPGDWMRPAKSWTRVPAFDASGRRRVWHLFDRLRPDMRRGVPILAPVIETMVNITRLTDNEVLASVMAASIAIEMSSEGGDLGGQLESAPGRAESGKPPVKLTEGGMILDLLPGEKVRSVAAERPNLSFDPFFLALVRQCAAAANLSESIVMRRFTASYSASRAELEMVLQFVRTMRSRHVAGFVLPAYAMAMDEAVARRRLRAPGYFRDPRIRQAYLGVTCTGPGRPTLDPNRESQADKTDYELGVTSLTKIAAKRGDDYNKIYDQRRREKRWNAGNEASPASSSAGQPPPPDGDDTEDETEDDA